ncbi:MAG: ABC transporter substrate-binding protein [bacterium]
MSAFALVACVLFGALRISAAPPPDMTVYYGIEEEEAEVIIKAFEKESGARVEGVQVKTGIMVEKLEKEKESPVASVLFGGSLPAYLTAKSKGLLEAYRPPGTKKFDRKFFDKDGMWTGIYVGIIGFCTNENLGVKPPKSWKDLLNPEYKSRIVLSSPLTSGTAYTYIATLVQIMGEDETFDYLMRLDLQVMTYTRSGSEPCKMVNRGAAAVGLSFAHDIISIDPKGRNTTITFPREGTGIEIGGSAIVKGAPNPELARKFIDFLADKKIQGLYGKGILSPRFPTNPDVPPPSAAFVKSGELKLIQFDFQWSGKNEERLKKKWDKLIGSKRKK